MCPSAFIVFPGSTFTLEHQIHRHKWMLLCHKKKVIHALCTDIFMQWIIKSGCSCWSCCRIRGVIIRLYESCSRMSCFSSKSWSLIIAMQVLFILPSSITKSQRHVGKHCAAHKNRQKQTDHRKTDNIWTLYCRRGEWTQIISAHT